MNSELQTSRQIKFVQMYVPAKFHFEIKLVIFVGVELRLLYYSEVLNPKRRCFEKCLMMEAEVKVFFLMWPTLAVLVLVVVGKVAVQQIFEEHLHHTKNVIH
jgi:hypothetical protein